MKKLFLFSTAFTIFLCMVFLLYLENGRNNYSCAAELSSRRILVCDPNIYPANAGKSEGIKSLIQKKAGGINPTPEELLSVAIFAPYKDMEGLNGVYCNENIIVRDNLNENAKLFVARHELDHAFQWAGVADNCPNAENCAVMSAAAEYPIGFVDLVVSSLAVAYNDIPDKQCFLFSSWHVFRTYILP
jgi:hypothetical protein